jgi:tetratricopeptide (TPR) repeat protein
LTAAAFDEGIFMKRWVARALLFAAVLGSFVYAAVELRKAPLFVQAYGRGDYEQALRSANLALGSSGNVEALRFKARACARLKRYEESLSAFRRLPNLDAEDHYLIGLAFTESGEIGKALHHLTEALDAAPTTDVHRALAVLYYLADDGKRAVFHAEKVAEDPKQEGGGLALLAELHHHFRHYAESVEDVKRLFEARPRMPLEEMDRFHLMQASNYVALNQEELAESQLLLLGDIESRPEALLLRAAAAASRSDLAAAERDWLKIYALDPTRFEAVFRLGDLNLFRRADREAVKWFSRAEALRGSDPAVHQKLATAYARLGDKASSEKHLALMKQKN